MRNVIINNNELTEILNKRAVIYRKIGKINEQLSELDKERTKLGYKMDKLKEQTQVIMDKEMPALNVGKYEVVTRIYINQEKYNEVEILDKIEEYQKMLDEEIEKANNKE